MKGFIWSRSTGIDLKCLRESAKGSFEKCTRWRKVCGRSAKDQIGDSIYSFFLTISSERFAKGARKKYPLEPCPAQNGLHLAMPDIGPREKKQHITMTFWLLPFINNNRFIVWFVFEFVWFHIFDSWYEFLILENATLMGPRKEAKDSRKNCERGVPGNFYLAQPPYIR